MVNKCEDKIFRLISILAIVALFASNINIVVTNGGFNFMENKVEFYCFVLNLLCCILFFFVVLFPTKLEFFAIISFIYSVFILIMEPKNPMGVSMYALCILSLCTRGFFYKHKKIKYSIVITVFLLLVLTEIRFGKRIFLDSIFLKIGNAIVLLGIIFFIRSYTINRIYYERLNNILDIKTFPKLAKRDPCWLIDIQNNKKYDAIAIENNLTSGSVKNRIKFVFYELSIRDKHDFMNKYSDFKIIYGDEDLTTD